MSLIDDIRKALQGEKKSDFIDQLLKEKSLYEALHDAGYVVVVDDPQARARVQPLGVLSTQQKLDAIIQGSQNVTFRQALASIIGWISPDGFLDPDSQWTGEPYAYDGNEATFAQTLVPNYPTVGSFLYLTFSTPVSSNKLRFKTIDTSGVLFQIDVHLNGTWINVWYGQTYSNTPPYFETAFDAGIVDEIRICFWMPSGSGQYVGVVEIKLWNVGTTSGGELITVEAEKGTVIPFNQTATADLYTPATGKRVKVWSGFYYCPNDIITELKFKNSGKVILGLPTLGSVGMELKRTEMLGAIDDVLQIYLGGAGTVKGWVSVSDE